MTYARSRLWLGISSVGSLVVVTQAMLFSAAAARWLPTSQAWSLSDAVSLALFQIVVMAFMLPADLLGGLILPSRFGRQKMTVPQFFSGWMVSALVQAALFLVFGLSILAVGRIGGRLAAVIMIFIIVVCLLAIQRRLAIFKSPKTISSSDTKVDLAMKQLDHWGQTPLASIVVEHMDPGFTGGVVGLPRFESLILPRAWVETLSNDQLAAAIARRVEAIHSGGRTRGVWLAIGWVTFGFLIASFLPGAGVTSVAELVSTCLGFTGWSFIGLLVLPTISRQSSRAIDRKVIERGVPAESLMGMLKTLDRLQDDEPARPSLVETIFHPVPSFNNRQSFDGHGSPMAWHAARMMLFLSWSCMGILARAVHCNVGRPELWVMLPTD
jgi:hypothetical protein